MLTDIDKIRSGLKSIDDLTKMQKESYPLLLQYIEEYNRQGHGDELSLPFYSGLPEWVKKEKKTVIMIIGQESRNSGRFNPDLWGEWTTVKDANWKEWEIQTEWVNAYTKFQLTTDENCRKELQSVFPTITNNNGPFWSFIHDLCVDKFYPFYTNVDKVHRYVSNDNCGKDFGKDYEDKALYTAPLTFAIEEEIYNKFKESKQDFILKREIEIIQPDTIVFITGPNYDWSIRYALGNLDKSIGDKPSYKKSAPNLENICVTADLGFGIPTFWTYHPNYLSNSGLRKNDWFGIIKKILESK